MKQRVVYLLGPRQLELREVPVPDPGCGELLLRIDAATTCGTDLKVYRRGHHATMLTPPCPFGHEMTGTVAALGAGVDHWHEGDAIVVANSASCGECRPCRDGRENLCADLVYINGAFGEYVLVPERFVRRSTYRRPSVLAEELAPIAEPLACVLHGLDMCSPRTARTALVLGGGPIGQMFVIELVRTGFAVVLADLAASRLATGRSLGAAAGIRLTGDRAADAATVRDTSGGFDLVVEATGRPEVWRTAIDVVGTGGEVMLFGGCPKGSTLTCDNHRLHYSEITVRGVYHHRPATFTAAIDRLCDEPAPFRTLISEERPLEEVETALERMAGKEILKACIRPGSR